MTIIGREQPLNSLKIVLGERRLCGEEQTIGGGMLGFRLGCVGLTTACNFGNNEPNAALHQIADVHQA